MKNNPLEKLDSIIDYYHRNFPLNSLDLYTLEAVSKNFVEADWHKVIELIISHDDKLDKIPDIQPFGI